VFGPDDEPLAHAPVEAEPEDGDNFHRRLTMTTNAGTFIINGVPPGTFHVWAWKGDLGYSQDMGSPFYTVPGRQSPTVTVAPRDVAMADIHLGPKNGDVNIVITDERGNPIPSSAHVVVSRPDVPERLEKDVRNRAFIAVPPTPIRLSVDAEGYAQWHYGGDNWQEEKGLLTVGPGEIFDLKVQLHPNR